MDPWNAIWRVSKELHQPIDWLGACPNPTLPNMVSQPQRNSTDVHHRGRVHCLTTQTMSFAEKLSRKLQFLLVQPLHNVPHGQIKVTFLF
jgi:hypothetical protein